MIKITQWSPDTCKCVINYSWDTELPEKDRVHTVHSIVNACHFHVKHTDQKIHFDTLIEENTRKNKAIQILAETHDELAVIDTKGLRSPDLSKISFTFNEDRDLNVVLSVGVDKETLKAALNAANIQGVLLG